MLPCWGACALLQCAPGWMPVSCLPAARSEIFCGVPACRVVAALSGLRCMRLYQRLHSLQPRYATAIYPCHGVCTLAIGKMDYEVWS